MKKLFLNTFLLLAAYSVSAQLSIIANQSAQSLVNKIVATSSTSGVSTSNAKLTCDPLCNGLISGNSSLGINDGIILGSGYLPSNVQSPFPGLFNQPFYFSATSSTDSNFSDNDLATLVGTSLTIQDACVLEFDLVPAGSFIEFEYVFGSEEYPEFNCTVFNDVFGFFISGPGITGKQNIAIIPNTNTPVSINTINDGTNNTGTCIGDTSYYNVGLDSFHVMDGYTDVMKATIPVSSGSTYHLKIAISDVMDQIMDSYVILRANSLKSGNTQPSNLNTEKWVSGLSVRPTLFDNKIEVTNTTGKSWQVEIVDMQGNVKSKFELGQQNYSIDMSNYAHGNYLMRVSGNGSVYLKRLMK